MYNTKQKQILIDFLTSSENRQFSIKEITENLCKDNKIGKSTVYRLVLKLVDEGTLKRFNTKGKNVVYQYMGKGKNCNSHFHLKCTDCGLLVHLDCDYMSKVNDHINTHHKFNIDSSQTILYGKCEVCGQKGC